MKCSISPNNIDILKRKIVKDLLNINEKGQPWSVDEYIREIYDFVFDATEDQSQKDREEKSLDAARFVPIFMERFKSIDTRIRSAIKLNTDTNAIRLEELVDDFTSDKGLTKIKEFLFPISDIDVETIEKAGIHGHQANELLLKYREGEFGAKPATAEATTGNEMQDQDDPVKVLGYKVIRDIINKLNGQGLNTANSLGFYIKSIRTLDLSDDAFTKSDLKHNSNPDNKDSVKNGVNWVITDKFGTEILFKEDSNNNIIISEDGIPIRIAMRALETSGTKWSKDKNGNYKLKSPWMVQTIDEVAIKIFGPKYTEEDKKIVKQIRQDEINRLGEIRKKTILGENIIASITNNSSLGTANIDFTKISEINNDQFKDGIFDPFVSDVTIAKNKIKRGFTYFYSNDNVAIEIDRPKLTPSQIETIANFIAMPVNFDGRVLSDQEKLDFLSSVYNPNNAIINFGVLNNQIYFKVAGKYIKSYPNPEAARNKAVELLTNASKSGKATGRMNIKSDLVNNNKQITLYNFIDGKVKAKILPYSEYIKKNFLAKTSVKSGIIELYNAYFAYELINDVNKKEPLISTQDRKVVPTVVEDPELALKPLEEKTLVVDESNSSYYVEEDIEGNVIQGTERLRQSRIKERLKPFPKGISIANNKGAVRGIIIDELLRAYLAGGVSNIDEIKKHFDQLKKENLIYPQVNNVVQKDKGGKEIVFNDALFESLFEIFKNIKNKLSDDYIVYSDLPALWGELGGEKIAAKIDILLYNTKTKTFSILDLKTAKRSRQEEYNDIDSTIDYKTSDQIQLSIYAELFKQATGIVIDKLGVIPIIVNERQGQFYTAELEKGTSNDIEFLLQPWDSEAESIYEISNRLGDVIENSVVEYPSVQKPQTSEVKATIPQNLQSGIKKYGTLQEANSQAKKALGSNPTSIDMIENGFRTRTTRSKTEMDKYNIQVGDIVEHVGKSADGTTKTIKARVTAIHPKGTPGFIGTWVKEGWTAEGVSAIERFKDGAAAIEFELIQPTEQTGEVGSIQSNEQDNYDATKESPTDLDPDDIINSFGRSKNLDNKATKEQIRKAKEWYENHPLNEFIKYKAMFNIVNSKNWAEFNQNGIFLYQGSNFTDLYHEAWHGFSQMYMTVEQKKDLYSSVKKKSGTFINYKGDKVSFKKATDLMLEEYLAEEFRKYVLSKGTKKISQPKVKSIFQKIFDFLKNLFGFTTLDQVIIDPINSNKTVSELFEKLRVGEINDYTYSLNNQIFDTLSSGFKSLNNEEERSFQDARLINETIDSLMSEFVDKVNMVKGRIGITNIFQKEESLGKAYEYTRLRLIQIRDEQLKLEPTSQVNNNIDLLNFSIENFGTYSTHVENKKLSKKFPNITLYQPKGVIGLHQTKTNFLNLDLKVESDIVESLDSNDEKNVIKGFERAGTELSVKQLASSEILYLLSSLYDKSFKNPDGVKNALGVKKLANFKKVWHHTVDLLQGQRDSQKVYQMLVDESDSYPIYKQLIEKLGNPLDAIDKNEAFSIWAKFMESFNRTRISLVQTSMDVIKDEDDQITDYNLTIGEASADWRKVKYELTNGFNLRPADRFIKRNDDNINYLDVKEVIKKWGNKASSNPFAFFVDIGMDLDEQNPLLINQINENRRMQSFASAAMFKIALLDKKNKSINNIIEDLDKNYSVYGEKAKGQSGNIKVLSSITLKFSDKYSSGMVSNAKNENQYEYSLQNSLSIISNALNQANSFDELIATGYMSYLGEADYMNESSFESKNPFTYIYKDENDQWMSTSKLLNSLFDFENGGVKRSGIKVNLNNLSGIALIEDDATDLSFSEQTSKLGKSSKLIQDFHLLLSPTTAGASSESLKHASKSASYSAHVSNITTPGDDTHLYVDTKHFIKSLYGNLGESNAVNIIIPYINAELNRAKRARSGELDNVPSYKKNALNLTIFESILGKPLSEKLFDYDDLIEELKENVELKSEISDKIVEYFNKKEKELKARYQNLNYISPNLRTSVKNSVVSELSNEVSENALYKSFVYNKFIKDFESMIIYYGDSAQYKTALAFFKRNAGIASTGRFPLNDSVAISRVQAMTHGYTNSRNKSFNFDGTFNSAVFKDQKLDSIYYKTYYKTFENYYKKKGFKGKKLKDAVEQELNAYLDMEVGDGQGWITFDSYRVYQDLLGRWSPNQEALYQRIIKGEKIDPKTITEFFPPKKVQYWGPLSKKGLPVRAFHKLSLLPLIPTVIEGSSLEDLHNNMVDQGINYALYESASKLGTLTNRDGQIDDAFLDEKEDLIKPFDPNAPYTKNIVYLDFLKDQLDIGTKFKNQVTFATQLRKLAILGLFEKGIPADIINKMSLKDWNKLSWGNKLKESDYLKKSMDYIDTLNELMVAKREELLQKAGWKKVNNEYKGDINKLLTEVILPNLERGDLSESELRSLKTNINGNLVFPLGMNMSASRIEKLLYSAVNRTLVRQKVKGDMEVQASNSMLGNKESISQFRSATDEEKEKYKGTIDLPSYTEGFNDLIPGPTNAAKIKLALKGDFVNLLKLKDLDGNEIGDRLTLNKMIRDDAWLDIDDHRKMITLVGVRIPVQALNSAEFMEIYEFLPEEAGNIIIPPAEIVAKSGADFDIDKLTMMAPSITLNNGVVSLTKEGIRGIENKLMFNIKDILSMPDNFIRLVRPNSNALGKEIATSLAPSNRDQESHINILDPLFNVDMHEAFNIAGQALGIGAVDNVYNPLFNYSGMYLNNTYNLNDNTYDTRILLDHNIMDVEGSEHISLSNLVNTNDNDIDQVLEQLMNGWVDAESDLWIFDLNARTELASTFLLLVQAGVSLKDAALFLNNPLVKEYVEELTILKSPFALPMGRRDISNPNVKQQSLSRMINSNFRNFGTFADKGVEVTKSMVINNAIESRTEKFSSAELNNILKKDSEGYTDLQKQAFLHFIELQTLADSITSVKSALGLDTNPVDTIYQAEEYNRTFNDIFENNLIPRQPIDDIRELSPISSFQDIASFQRDLWKPFFPIRQNQTLDGFLSNYLDSTAGRSAMNNVVGNINNKDLFILNFKNALTDYIFQNNVIDVNINSKEYKSLGVDTANTKIIKDMPMLKHGVFVKDGVMYVDKNRLRKIYDTSLFADNSYRVMWINGKLTGNSLLPASAFKARGFSSESSFVKFMYEKEHLRYIMPYDSVSTTQNFKERLNKNINVIDTIETKRQTDETDEMFQKRMEYLTYDQIITNKALDNTLNIWKMFYSVESMANQWFEIKKKYGSELSSTYDLIDQLIPDKRVNSKIKNLKLKDRLLESDDVNTYNQNLIELSDPGVTKLNNMEANLEVSDFFNRLNFFAMIQSGIGTVNEFSMTRIIDHEKVMTAFASSYKNFDVNNNVLEDIMSRFISQNRLQNRSTNIRLKNYIDSRTVRLIDRDILPKTKDEEKLTLQKIGKNVFTYKTYSASLVNENSNVTFITESIKRTYASKDKKIINDIDIQNFKSYIEKSNKNPKEFFTTNTKFIEFYNINKGKKETIPQSSKWFLQSNGRYDLIDKDTGEIYIQDVDLKTGYQYISERKNEFSLDISTMLDKNIELNKEQIDSFIEKIKQIANDDNPIALLKSGYFQEKIVNNPKTFVYLSKKLFELEGYINPKSILSSSLRAVMQKDALITDQEIEDLKNKCFI